jgi:serine/threonine-protein kinase
MSPEQARALPTMDHQCDVWSMAVLSYAMLTGKTPWPGETMQDVLVNVCRSEYVPLSVAKPELGDAFDPFYARAFQRKAEHRYVDAEQMVDAFRLCAGAPRTTPPIVPDASSGVPIYKVGELTVPTPTPDVIPGVSDGRSRGRWWAGAAALLLLVGLVFFWSRRGEGQGSSGTAEAKPVGAATATTTDNTAKAIEPKAVSPTDLPIAPTPPKVTPTDPKPTGKPPTPAKAGTPSAQPPAATAVTAPQPTVPAAPAPVPSAVPKPHDPSAVL